MPSLKAIRTTNDALPRTSPTAVFVGATSGIGLGTVEALLQNTTSPNAILVGRSQSKFASTLARLRTLNEQATITFVEAQVSLLKEVNRVCSVITTQHKSIDLLWLSQGGLANATGSLSSEGLNDDLAISFYSRMLFIQQLTPLLSKSTNNPRVVLVLTAGEEGTLRTSDLGLQNAKDMQVFPLMKHNVTMTSLALNQFATQYPNISFIHTNPGMVSTQVHDRWIENWTGVWAVVGTIMRWTLVPFFHWLGLTPEKAGQIGFFELTDPRFDATSGTNFWRLSEKADLVKASSLLNQYVKDGWGGKVVDHVEQVHEKVLGQ